MTASGLDEMKRQRRTAVAMVSFSHYPDDARPRRTIGALVKEGMAVDVVCLAGEGQPRKELVGGVYVRRIPVKHRRGGPFAYVISYAAFIVACTTILAVRSVRRRYDVVYVNNMPDVLVACALIPKLLGAKVILDLHDPMPELMTTIFGLPDNSISVRLLRWLEKWSTGRADLVLTVNKACRHIFGSRSCHPEKIGVVMNSPDDEIFAVRSPRSYKEKENGHLIVMYHGSLVPRNGLDLAVAAMTKVRKTVPNAELRIYGRQTPFLDQVMKSVQSQGMQGFIRYLGPRRLEDLRQEIEECDVGVIPNHKNAFSEINTPTRIFEYLVMGKPVVAPNTRGIREYFDPDALFLFESGNADELARVLTFVACNRNQAIETAERGQVVCQRHQWAEERKKLVKFVNGLVNGRGEL